MPICKRDGFDNLSRNRDETFHDNDEVFFCEVTKEIFRDYEDYFRHVMVINSTVWQCEATGRENLTYQEALRSERHARKKMELFKDCLRPPVMLVVDQAKQSSLNSLSAIVCKFLRKRFFLNEEVSACYKSSKYNAYKVIAVVPPEKTPPANGVYEETELLCYKLCSQDSLGTEVIVPFEKIRRQRSEFTTENMQMFIRDNVTRVDGILRPKPESYKQYVTDRNITFASIFIGLMPHFTPAKIKRPHDMNGKKQSTLNKYLVKGDKEEKGSKGSKETKKLSEQELENRERQRAEKAEAKAKSLREEMERVRREKQERVAELERQKLEKRAKLIERVEAECSALLTKTDDLERTDQRLLPTFTPVNTHIPMRLLGDAFVVREFLHSFGSILSGIEVLRGNLNFYELTRALTTREVAGPMADIILVCLGTVFDMQKEEEEECSVEYLQKALRLREPYISMSLAARAHFFAKRHFHSKINELPIDALTLSEVLRLHLLASGVRVKERSEKWRIKYRNGYVSSEDPGLMLRMRHPHILRYLKMYSVQQLPFVDIVRIVRCLIAQILTYSSPINLIEERMEQMTVARADLRALATTENIRLANVQAQKRSFTIEHNQQCLEDSVKNDPDKKRQLEEKLNKKIAELLAQSEREHRKYEQQVENLNAALFNFLVFLGTDRAYRKYYVMESIPGIFVEHSPDCMDTCLSEPPTNALGGVSMNAANLPRNRKELRAYLLRKYTDEEKKTALAGKALKSGNNEKAAKEDKENQLVNGLVNGDGIALGSNNETSVNKAAEEGEQQLPPTQYQLYMCTGDQNNCIVHDERNADRQRWAYLYEQEDIDALIESLNPLGERESHLREQLTVLRQLIVKHCKNCPVDILSVDSKKMPKFRANMLNYTQRKYGKSNYRYQEGSDLNEVIHTELVDRILQFESDIYTGDLGRLKVKDMEKWRTDLQGGTYDAQVKLQWGPTLNKGVISTADNENMLDKDDDDAYGDSCDTDDHGGGGYAHRPYRDPGAELGNSLEIDSEDSDDDLISLHDSETLRDSVRNCASALLQVEQAIKRRFIKEPFGVSVKIKDKEMYERKQLWGVYHLKQWEVSLMESTSYSQVFLHLNVLHDSILWARSTNKSLCLVCRRGNVPGKMLLCDECNGGTHMFCMKPKMKTVPEGNWYCNRCVKQLGLQNGKEDNKQKVAQKRKRTFSMDADDVSDNLPSVSKDTERRSGRRRSTKRLQSNDTEESAETINGVGESDAESDDNLDEGMEEEEEDEGETEEEVEDSQIDGESEDKNNAEARSGSELEHADEENICMVCSYEGGDLVCVRCKDYFHLECVNLRRPPLYIFTCVKCKSAATDKRARAKMNGKHAVDDSDDDHDDGGDEDDEEDDEEDAQSEEPPAKRTRPSRTSLRKSQQLNGSASQSEVARSSQRRSHRRTGDHLPLNNSALCELLDDVMKHVDAWPFLRPVSQAEVPDYHKIIKNPMDLAKVKSKLNMGAYQLNEEVMNDIQMIFNNCDQYNIKGNEVYQAGASLEKFVIERCKQLHLPFKPSDMYEA